MSRFAKSFALLLLFAGLLLGATNANALACNSTGVGPLNWNAIATWSCGRVPLNVDDVTIINNSTVTVNIAGAVANSVTIATGNRLSSLTFNAGSSLTVATNVTINPPTSGTAGRDKQILVNTGSMTVNGSVAMTGAAGAVTTLTTLNVTTGTITINGGLTITAGGGTGRATASISGAGTIDVNGAGGITNNDTVTVGTGTLNVTGGTFTNNNAVTVSTGLINVTGAYTNTAVGDTVTITGAGGRLTVGGTLTNAGSIIFNTAAGGIVNANGAFTSSGIVTNTTAGLLNIGGNATVNGTFTAGTGTVTFNGSAPQTSGGTAQTFNNLTVANTGAGTTTLTANATVAGNLSVNSGTLDLSIFTANRTAAGGTLTVANGATLKIGGTNPFPTNYTAPHALGATSTVEYSGTNQNVLNEGAPGYGHLTLSGSLTKTALGSFTVRGDLAITGVTFASVATIQTVNGNVSNTGTHTATTGSITLSGGAAAHDLSGNGTYANLILNDALGATLSGSPTVSGTLTLTSGVVTTGINTLVTAAACNLPSVTRTSGWVNGNLQKAIPAGASTCNFEVGDATKYTPVSTTFAALTTAGNLTASTVGTQHPSIADPSSGLDTTKMVNRYWTLTNGGVGLPLVGYSATFNFINPGDLTGGAATANFEVEKWGGFAWSATTAGTRNATNTTATGIIAFGAFAVGEKKPPTVVSINCSVSCAATGAASVSWTVTFSRSVAGVAPGNFTLVNAGLGGTPAITGVSGSGTTWTVTASTGTGTGTLGLNMTNTTGVTPAVTNLPFTGQVYAINGTVINTYYPGTTASVAVGATSIVLGAATGATTPIAAGDMLLIMQIQDASVDSTNTDAYGDGVGGDLVGRGTTGVGGSGLYEYAIAASNVAIGGGTLTLCGGTTNAYTNAVATGTAGQKQYQVIRVPVYASIALTPVLTALAWNGSTGGVLAFDVTGALNLNTATVDVSGMGFRGGASRMLAGPGATGVNTDYVTLAAVNNNASKGEGIAGTPQYVFTAPSTLTNTAVEGYPNGSHARGAPANAGGGATDRSPTDNQQNSGGGGGANGGAGGIGGIGWCGGGPLPDTGTFSITAPYYGCGYSALASATNPGGSTGGFGGAAVTGLGATRLTLGGGGGGGTTNNGTGALGGLSSSGAAGGGIIMLRAGSMTGAATFNANGSNADNTVANDGSGGGGAGGVVLISAGLGIGGATINVKGGTGGTNLGSLEVPASSAPPHGPGGGGGGGYAITTGAPAAPSSAAAGANGLTYNNNVLFGDTVTGSYGAMKGSAGSLNPGLSAASIPGAALGTGPCAPLVDHYAISHSGTGITCEAEPVTIMAHGSSHASPYPDAGLAGKTISLTTNTSSGTWLSSADSCTRTCYNTAGTDLLGCGNGFTNTVGNNGTASYTFAAGESGIRLCLKQNSAVTQNINVTDGTATEATGTAAGEGGAGTDPTLAFSDTGIRFYADGAVDTIASQIAGVRNDDAANHPSTQTLTVRALKSGTTTPARCVPLLTSVTRTVQFAYRCEGNPNTCSSSAPLKKLEVNGTAVTGFNASATPVPADDVSVAFNGSGIGSINLKYFDVGQISVWAKATSIADSTTGSTFAIVAGNSNIFAVKPYDFEVIPCAASVVGDCVTPPADPGLAGGGSAFAKAGETFKATITARALGGSKAYSFGRCDSAGGTGCPAAGESVSLARTLAAPSGGAPGTLGGTTSANASSFVANSGAYTLANLNWDEVGVITLKASNANYLSNGLGACTTQTVGEKCQGTFGISGNLGRFIPDHFDTAVVATATTPMPCPTNPVALTCPLLYNGFVYSGQSFSVQVTAMNGLTTPTTTVNYDGTLGFSKDVTLTAWDAKGGATTRDPGSANNTIRAARFIAGTAPAALTGTIGVTSGSATVTGTGTLFLTQLAVGDVINISGADYIVSAIASATSLTLTASYVAATAAGLAAYVGPIYTFATVLTAPTDIYMRAMDTDSVTSLRGVSSVEGGVKVVSGRVKVSNAYGSELLPLTLTATAQYYIAAGNWVTSSTDNVTSLTLPLTYSVGTTGATAVTLTLTTGAPVVVPLTSTTGVLLSGMLTINLARPNPTGTGKVTVTPTSTAAYLPITLGTATFGVYKGRNEFIYMRENY